MHLTEEDIIRIKGILNEHGLLDNPPEGGYDGNWDAATQSGFDQYLKKHDNEFAEQMLGKQPGTLEQLGMYLGHALDQQVSLLESVAEEATENVKGWFDRTIKKIGDVIEEVTESAEELAAKARREADRVKQQAKEAAASAEAAAKAAKDALKNKPQAEAPAPAPVAAPAQAPAADAGTKTE